LIATLPAQKKTLLSKKSIVAVRNLKKIQKYLQDQSIIDEIEEFFGRGSYRLLKDIGKQGQDYSGQGKDEEYPAQDKGDNMQVDNTIELNPAIDKGDNILIDNPIDPNEEAGASQKAATEQMTTTPSKQVSFNAGTIEPSSSKGGRTVSRTADLRNLTQTAEKNGLSDLFDLLNNTSIMPRNPYRKNISLQPPTSNSGEPRITSNVDKPVALKKGMIRNRFHKYTLCFKTIKAKEEEDRQQIIQDTLQKFLDIVLQADPKTIIPPYLELDRADKAVPDISNGFTVSSVDAHYALKKYMFRLSLRDDTGVSWCSLILAQSTPFQVH
jgi:hypothetical protein